MVCICSFVPNKLQFSFNFFQFHRVVSNVISLTMGERWSRGRFNNNYKSYSRKGVHATQNAKLNQPVTITFTRVPPLTRNTLGRSGQKEPFLWAGDTEPLCAFWDPQAHRWATLSCSLVAHNSTHSVCSCYRLATFALLAPPSLK